ncbi:MAG: hypothetical protein M0Z59_01990 [Nitrospiraceae bacterium]|nr:hypothetical protein [Nitrospiraceae bacterium]
MLEEIAWHYGMTEASLRFLIRHGIIQEDLTERNLDFLSDLGQIWQDLDWLKISLRRRIKSKALREKFIRELDLTKPERYVLNRYLNAKGRLSIGTVAAELSMNYGMPEGIAKGVVRKMRGQVYMTRYRQKPGKNGQRRPRAENRAAARQGGRSSFDEQTATRNIFGLQP